MPRVTPNSFSSVIQQYLDEYGDEVIEANETAVRKVAKDVTKELKKAGDFGGSGKYRKGLTFEVNKSNLSVEARVGAGRNAGLTHLLEYGHAKQNGGRTRAFSFVAPINDTVEQKYMKEMEELLK